MSEKPQRGQGSGEIPVAEWARQCGITVQAANKRIRTLGIPRCAGGGIDPVVAARFVAEKLDARQQRGRVMVMAPVQESRPVERVEAGEAQAQRVAVEPARDQGEPADALNAARLRHESAKADKARIEADLLQGTVVRTEEVMETWGALISPAKTRLLSLGAKLGPLVAIEADAATCQSMIDGAVYEALAEISEYRPVQVMATAAQV